MNGRKGEQDALQGTYLRAKAAVNDEAERSVRDELPRAQWRVIGKGVALWLVPLLCLYALGLAFARQAYGLSTLAQVTVVPDALHSLDLNPVIS